MPRKIVILKGSFAYDVVEVFSSELARAFEDAGREVIYIDILDQEKLIGSHDRLFHEDCEFILAFSAIRSALTANGKSVYDLYSFPYVALLIDHPYHHMDRFNIKNMLITCFDRSHLDFLSMCRPDLERTMHLPHGGCRSKLAGSESERSVNVLFPGSWSNPEEHMKTIRSLKEPFVSVLLAAAEMLKTQDCSVPIEDSLFKAALQLNIDYKNDALIFGGLLKCLSLLDWYIRAYKRFEILRCLDRAGIKVDIYGRNWPEDIFRNHIIHKERKFEEILFMMTRSKIVLSMALVPDGSHERVFSSMLNGAVCAAHRNPYLSENFEDASDILFYDWTKIHDFPAKLDNLLSNAVLLSETAEKGKLKSENDHTWKNRANSILDAVSELNK